MLINGDAILGGFFSRTKSTNSQGVEKTSYVSTPMNNAYMKAMSTEGSIFSLAQNKVSYMGNQNSSFSDVFSGVSAFEA
jgi:hypothetical protein